MAALNGFSTLPTLPQHQGDSQYAGSQSPGQPSKDPAQHQRTYQACIPCRRRKVRCDLGSVDNPHEPPCLRCRRESKECYFSSTRRKKKSSGAADSGANSDEEPVPEVKSGRKRLRTSLSLERDEEVDEEEPRTPGGSLGRRQPLRRPQPAQPVKYTEQDEKASDQTAAMLQASEVHGGHDALKVLYQAAQIRDRMNSREYLERPDFSGMPSELPPVMSPIRGKAGLSNTNQDPTLAFQSYNTLRGRNNTQASRGSVAESTPAERAALSEALKAWSRFRFVREGWFTAKEGIAYIKYFYKYLAPLTPVAIPDFRQHETHERLLVQEPMLTITILLIASRHMRLEGPGAVSRPYEIHKRLWSYLQGMINRVVWGQEQYGGGVGGVPSASIAASDVNPLSRKGLRTLGSVEALVLLTEWHPRMMHFPPEEADIELMLPSEPISTPVMPEEDDMPKVDEWLEPVWRSDRMCWMLLGMAMNMAYEIGVFDADWQRHTRNKDGQLPSAEGLQVYDRRRGSVRDLLLVYVTQTSGRLGLTTVLPSNYSKPEDSDLYHRQVGQHANLQETIMHFWLRMAAIIREGNSNIFANKAFTRDLVKNGDYRQAIIRMSKPLAEWRHDFDKCLAIPKYMRCILMIETYINALALQAVAERCANEQPMEMFGDPREEVVRHAHGLSTTDAIPPQTLNKWLGGDRVYMLAVGDAARSLLKIVVEGLYPDEYLRHAPVRTYFRIISVAIILLKSFSLGASESDVLESLSWMDRTVEALQTCIVDDVHVASRFAELLSRLSQSLKPRLIRITADGRTVRSRRVSQYGTPAPVAPLNDNTNYRQQTQQQQQQQAMSGAMPTQQQWNYNNLDNSNINTSNGYNNSLLGISNNTYDLTDNDFSVMPPPDYMQSPNQTGGMMGTGAYDPVYGTNTYGNNGPEDWLALPLDNLFGNSGSAIVNQTMYGPQIDGQDMLEVLLRGGGQGGHNGFN
ncbi:zinc finger transcriptional activator [Elasticomyces elasticus]|nr:zinc finger transcriptional activator [Elasticomyces elasticus]